MMRSAIRWICVNTFFVVAGAASLGPGGADALAARARPGGSTTTVAAETQGEPTFSENKSYKHRWIDVDRTRAHYIEAGKGPTLVLVHGALPWSNGEAEFGKVVGLLSDHFHVVVPDIVGFGYTKPRGPQDYTGQAQGDFLVHFIEALHLGPLFLSGDSHGGFLTQYVTLERPGLVKKLVITNSLDGTSTNRPTITPSEKVPLQSQTKDQIRTMLERYYKHKDLVTDEQVRLAHDIYQRNYEYFSLRNQAVFSSVERYNQNLSYKGKHISEWGGQLHVPVLLVWSEPGSRLEWGLAHLARVPGSEMHILPWSGHHLFMDQSARWAQVVTDWLLNEPARPPN
jgi:pimeloyl-ACP methyl ester carboxylesterase